MEKIKIIIADDHAVFRLGLRNHLQENGDMEVVAEAENGIELLKMAEQYVHDVIITDLVMAEKNGIDTIEELYAAGSRKIIAISTFDDTSYITDAIKAGAMGFVLKDAISTEIIKAVQFVNNNQKYYCSYTSSKILKIIETSDISPGVKRKQELFSEIEKDIIRLVCQDKTSDEIAELMFMSKRTIDGIRARITAKMNVKGLAAFGIYAVVNFIFIPEKGKPPLDKE